MILDNSNGDDENQEVEVEVKAPKKRAETWVQDERAETWVQAEVKQALVGVDFIRDERKRGSIDHPSCAPISGGTCLKSSRRQSTRGRKKKKKKKERIQKERMGSGETKRKIWEEEENKVEKETKYKQKKI